LVDPPVVLVGGGVAEELGNAVSPWKDWNGVDVAGTHGVTTALGCTFKMMTSHVGAALVDGSGLGVTTAFGSAAAKAAPDMAVKAATSARVAPTARAIERREATSSYLHVIEPESSSAPYGAPNM
jgi:hypothetical protein